MGKVIQRNNYVIVFNATAETFEDTLFYFDSDLKEFVLEEGIEKFQVFGVHINSLEEDLTFRRAFVIDEKKKMAEVFFDNSLKPSMIHILHLITRGERETHRLLSSRFKTEGIKMVNPYNEGVSTCDSKFRTQEILKNSDVPVPPGFLISRFTDLDIGSFRKLISNVEGDGTDSFYLQPARGTESIGCFFFDSDGEDRIYKQILQIFESGERELILRKGVGNLLYEEEKNYYNFILRINIAFDGRNWKADSGYAMVGGDIVGSVHGAERRNINNLLRSIVIEDSKEKIKLNECHIEKVKNIACNAVEKVFAGFEPSLLVGVDIILQLDKSGLIPFVIDLNPRPVVVGSRLIGEDKINLGKSFWRGVFFRFFRENR